MSKRKNSSKVRVHFRKNRGEKTRQTDLTRDFHRETFREDDTIREERISGKGSLIRQRTVRMEDAALAVGEDCRCGQVVRVHGLNTLVEDVESGQYFRCATRRLLKTLATEERHVVVAGDLVQFRPAGSLLEEESLGKQPDFAGMENLPEGMIERVEPRYGCLCRTSRKRQHILVSNVDQLLIVTSLFQPGVKWNLIDRMIIMAEKMEIEPVICLNKVDLGDPLPWVPTLGVYARMGYAIHLVSAVTGFGIERLRQRLQQKGVRSVVAGQSGVGKSSILNAVEPGLDLKTSHVSEMNEKGRHTTTTAQLIKLSEGGYVADTPGIRQFELWDIIREEVPGYFREMAPLVSLCRFPDCSHTHEEGCAVREAVSLGQMNTRRYESYCQIWDSCTSP